jgi:protein ImuB
VVEHDKPQGKILWVNERARACRILPGMRYIAGLSLDAGLRAAEVPPRDIEHTIASLGRRLRNFTPQVEPAVDDPGVFWLDATGLERLYGTLGQWADQVRAALQQSGFLATVVVGFQRFGTYAVAKAKSGVIVLDSAADERAVARDVPLERLAFEPAARDTLGKLGVRTVGDFMDLPSGGIERRFGQQIQRLHQLASGGPGLPLQPERPEPPAQQCLILDHPETNVARLMLVIEGLLGPLLKVLVRRGHVLTKVSVRLHFDRLGEQTERVRPAAPTLDAAQLLELIRLRLDATRKLPDGVVEIGLTAESTEAASEQLQLFAQRPKRDVAAANRALARLRAEFGDAAVMRARLCERHLPEAGFAWEAVDAVAPPKPRDVDGDNLVRRIYAQPIPLPSRPRHEPDGWMLRGLQQGPVVRVLGPYIVSGGWWRRAVHREYHFAETQKGELLWVYYDRVRRQWFLQGRVE